MTTTQLTVGQNGGNVFTVGIYLARFNGMGVLIEHENMLKPTRWYHDMPMDG